MQDARRFILEFRFVIEIAPLQLYNSAPVFSPDKSIVKCLFSDQMPRCIESVPKVEKNWTSSIQALEGHSERVRTAIFSPKGQPLLASASNDRTVKLWDATTGNLRCTVRGHRVEVNTIAFSPDGQLIASGSANKVQVWNPITGQSRWTFEGHLSEGVDAVLFSPDSQILAFMSEMSIRLWDSITGESRGIFGGHMAKIEAISFSPDGQMLASGSLD